MVTGGNTIDENTAWCTFQFFETEIETVAVWYCVKGDDDVCMANNYSTFLVFFSLLLILSR